MCRKRKPDISVDIKKERINPPQTLRVDRYFALIHLYVQYNIHIHNTYNANVVHHAQQASCIQQLYK